MNFLRVQESQKRDGQKTRGETSSTPRDTIFKGWLAPEVPTLASPLHHGSVDYGKAHC